MLRPFARGFSLGLRKFVTRSKPLERDELLKKVRRAWEAVCAGVWQKSVRERVAQRRNVSPRGAPVLSYAHITMITVEPEILRSAKGLAKCVCSN